MNQLFVPFTRATTIAPCVTRVEMFDIFAEPLDYSDFEMTVPGGPCLDLSLDEDRVTFFASDGLRKTISLPKGVV